MKSKWGGLLWLGLAVAASGQEVRGWLSSIASGDDAQRYEARMRLHALTAAATRPGAESERADLERMLVAAAGDVQTPLPARVAAVRFLETVGGASAVPVLGRLLSHPDADLRDSARRALEANPSPEAGATLLEALGGTADPVARIGLAHSLGVRRERRAVARLAALLDDPGVGDAAAAALGRIGGAEALTALQKSRNAARPSVAAAIIEAAPSAGEAGKASLLAIFRSNGPGAVRAAALSALLAMGGKTEEEVELVVSALCAPEVELTTAARAAGRQLAGRTLSSAIDGAWGRMTPVGRVAALELLDEAGRPRAVAALRDEDPAVAAVAVSAVVRLGGVGAVVALLEAAAGGVAKPAAESALAAMRGGEVEQRLRAAAESSPPPVRAAALRVLGMRRDTSARPLWQAALKATDPEVVRAACQALRTAGADEDVAPLADLALGGHADGMMALKAVLSRAGNRAEAARLVARRGEAGAPKGVLAALEVMPLVAGPAALDWVNTQLTSADGNIKAAAIRSLSAWPDLDGVEVLWKVAESGGTPAGQRTLALRGIARIASAATNAPAEARVEAARRVLQAPTAGPEEKKAAVSALGTIPHVRSSEILEAMLAGGEFRDEAAFALANMAAAWRDRDREATRRLSELLEKSGAPEAARKKAAEAAR